MGVCKTQIGCLIVVLYIAFVYVKECRRFQKEMRESFFDELLILTVICIFFDGASSYSVNHLEKVSSIINSLIHMVFYISIDVLIFSLFLYVLFITGGITKNKKKRILLCSPLLINILIMVFHIGSLDFQVGATLNYNYAVGISAYTCFFMEGIYMLLTVAVFIRRWNYMEHHKRISILTYLLLVAGIMILQVFAPEIFVTSIAATVLILGVYMNQEDPAMKGLSRYHDEMVMGFATLVENRDDNTGGHVKRTTIYVGLLAEELRRRGYFTETLTRDYMRNLKLAAPMHDIGKISVPDAILQKPGKLTDEEFVVMKGHAANGGRIIQKTFGKLQDLQYRDIAYDVARYHHEKWNGKGYPEGLKEDEIPLCARIMAVADVFDAVSEKRCYRDAMPMEQCFEIIRKGSGQDFDPIIAEIFLEIRDQVETVHNRIQDADMEKEQG